jgi:chemotaxis-related protein WspB
VVEVVPLLTMNPIPQAPKGVAGMIVYRGQAIPAVDLCELTIGHPARERLSTRIIIVEAGGREEGAGSSSSGRPAPSSRLQGEAVQPNPEKLKSSSEHFSVSGHKTAPCLVGLIAERATGMLRRDAADMVSSPSPPSDKAEMLKAEGKNQFQPSQFQLSALPWLGPVLIDERGVIQLLHPQKLLAENVRELIFGSVLPAPPATNAGAGSSPSNS